MSGYQVTKFKQSNGTKKLKTNMNNDTSALRNFYNTGYKQGAGGLSSQLNTAQQRLDTLYNNNNLSQQFNYSKQGAYNQALDALANRGPFKYDLAEDQLFQQAKEQYQTMGKAAMADTIGQASAMTGGYGNSYAATAGAQAYNNYLQQLNNSIGDYYAMALNAYNSENNRLKDVFSAYSTDKSAEQSEWKGDWDVYNNLYNMYSNDVNNLRGQDISLWNNKGEGLANVANLSTTQYDNSADNDYNVWNATEGHRQTQAQLEETSKQNAWERDYNERKLNEEQSQNAWERSYKEQLASKSDSSKKKKKDKEKTGLTKEQRKTNAKNVAMKVIHSIEGDVSAQPNLKIKLANRYIKEAQKSGKLDKKGAAEAYRLLGL